MWWRRRVVLWSVVGAVLVGGGVVGYALATREEGPSCDRVMANDDVQRLLGDAYESGMGCAEFGKELRAALTGKEPGQHTAAQARAMRAVVTEISKDVRERRETRVHKDLRQPVAGALADYADDVYDVVSFHTLGDREATDEVEDGRLRTALPRIDLDRTMLALSEDPVAHGYLFSAMAERCARKFATVDRNKLEAVKADDGGASAAVADICGWVMGWVRKSAENHTSRLDRDGSEREAWNEAVMDTVTKPAGAVPPFNRAAAAHVVGTWKQDLVERPRDHEYEGHARDLVTVWASALGFGEKHEVTNDLRLRAQRGNSSGFSALSDTADCFNGRRTC